MARCPVKLAYKLLEPKCKSSDHLSPLIFLHALSLSKEEGWEDIPQYIADQTRRKAYLLDARNHGDTEWTDEFDFDLNVTDLLHFMHQQELSKVVLIGHCMGGMTAIKAGLKEPEKIEMLFVEDIFLNVPESANEVILTYLNAFKELKIPSGIQKNEADKFITSYTLQKNNSKIKNENYVNIPLEIKYPLRKDSSGNYVFKANLDVLLKKSENINALIGETEGVYNGPSFFLIATESAFQVQREKCQMLKLFPKAVTITFESENHIIHQEFPELFIETIVKHIKLYEKTQL